MDQNILIFDTTHSFVVTHALGNRMYGYTLLVPMNEKVLKSRRSKKGVIHVQS